MHKIDYVVWKEEDQFVSRCLNVEVASCGDTRDSAIANLKEAVELYFEDESEIEFVDVNSVELGTLTVHA
jgi:predicted RNase H-like HicB family nuclease